MLARAAAARSDWQVPSYLSPRQSFIYLTPILKIVHAFQASAARHAAAGDLAGSIAELRAGLRFVQGSSRGGVVIHKLVEITSEAVLCSAVRSLALRYDLPPAVAGQMIAELSEMTQNLEPLSETMRGELRAMPAGVKMSLDPASEALQEQATFADSRVAGWELRLIQRVSSFLGSNPESTTKNLLLVYQQMIASAERPYDPAELRRLRNLVPENLGVCDLVRARDPLGLQLARSLLTTFVPFIFVRERTGAVQLEATTVIIALRQFTRDEHRPPDALAELVPKYLSEVPRDAFDGKPLRYAKKTAGQAVVYSVGPNQIDEGGVEAKQTPRSPESPGDLVFCECEVEQAQARLRR